MDFTQNSFRGGMNLIVDDTRLAENEYREAFNLRCRFDVLDSINGSEELYIPYGNVQGLYAFGDFLIAFISGQAYYRAIDETTWTHMSGFTMDVAAERLYVVHIPLTTNEYTRSQPKYSGNVSINSAVNLGNALSSSPFGDFSGLIVQDGINQPWFIYVDDTTGLLVTRQCQTYDEWTQTAREYVPIGKWMTWFDGMLLIVSADEEVIYRSVSGRPMDFVIAIDDNGDKVGDATALQYSVGTGGINCIRAMSSDSVFVSTRGGVCYIVSLDKSNIGVKLYGEFTFTKSPLFETQCIDSLSFVDILGDYAFVDPEGLRSFNAISQQQNEGRNSIFSLKVSRLFKGLLQSAAAAVIFDNYALFSVNTVYGYRIIVYDTLTSVFVCMDNNTNGQRVKQFAVVDTDVTELYAITIDNKLYRLYSPNEDSLTATFRTRSLSTQDPRVELKPNEVRCVLGSFLEASTVSCTTFVNNRISTQKVVRNIAYITSSVPYTESPALLDIDTGIVNLLFSQPNSRQGWKTFSVFNWTGGGTITNIQMIAEELTPMQSLLTQANLQNSQQVVVTKYNYDKTDQGQYILDENGNRIILSM